MAEVLTEVFELEKYLIRPKEHFEESEVDRKNLEEVISRDTGCLLDCEKFPIELIKRMSLSQKYIPLSTEFLKMSLEKETKFGIINVPRFGVNRYGETSMNIQISSYKGTSGRDISVQITNPQNFPEIMELPILEVFDFYDNKQRNLQYIGGYSGDSRYCHKVPKEVFKKWENIQGEAKSISLMSHFHAIIPKKVKEKVGDARRHFKNDIFIISEKKPEDWEIGWNQKQNITIDPLVVGYFYERGCYLIDNFDTSYLEKYIKSEWSQ